ncbi:hypothetical protein Tco_0177976 [Tanacetum coccineum]
MKIHAGVQVSRLEELRRHLQLWKCFGRLYFVVIVLDRNIKELQKHTEELRQEYSQKSTSEIQNIKLEHAEKQQKSQYTIKSSDKTTLAEFDQKQALFNSMHESKSFNKHPTNKTLSHALMEPLIANENTMDNRKRKTSKDAQPSKNPKFVGTSKDTSHSQPKSTGKSVQSEETVFEVVDTEMSLNQGDDIEKPPLTFYDSMSTPIDFSAFAMNRLQISKLTKADLVGPVSRHDVYATMRILSVTTVTVDEWYGYGHLKEIIVRRADQKLYKSWKNLRLGYNKDMKRRKWTTTDQKRARIMIKDINQQLLHRRIVRSLEKFFGGRDYRTDYRLLHWTIQNRRDLPRDIPLVRIKVLMYDTKGVKSPGSTKATVPTDFFFNNDLKYLRGGSTDRKYTASTTKTKAVKLDVEAPYTTLPEPQGVIYEDKLKRKRLMRTDELYKFSDGTLTSVRDTLDQMLKNLRLGYNKDMKRRK